MKNFFHFGVFAVLAGSVWAGPVVREGDLWRYYEGTNNPAAQSGVTWTKTSAVS